MKQIYIPRLRQERDRRGWSRSYVAEQIEVDVITVGRWERGERMPHPQYRQKLCALFEMSAQDLGLFSEPPQESSNAMAVDTHLSEGERFDNKGYVESPLPEPVVCDGVTIDAARLEKVPSKDEGVTQTSSLIYPHRRKFLIGFGGLGVAALIGGGFFLSSHLSSASRLLTSRPSELVRKGILAYQFLDPNLSNWVNRASWSPNNSEVALANGTSVISIWNLEKGALVDYYPTSNAWVNDVSWSRDDRIAAATADFQSGSIQIWQVASKKSSFTLHRPYSLRTVSWSPNDRYLAFAGHTTIAEVWNPSTSRQVSKYLYPALGQLGMNRIKWSITGTYLACAADDGTIHVWEALSGKSITIYRGHQHRVHDLAWSPDGRYITSAGADKTTQVWEALTGRLLLTYTGHTDEVEAVDWSPQGKYIVSGGKDPSVRIWEALTGKLIMQCTGSNSPVEGLAWSSDGTMVAAGTDKRGLLIWKTS